MKWLSSYSFPFPALNFKFSERTFYILLNERQCVVRLEAVVFTHLTKVTWRNSHCRFYTPSTTSGLGTPLTSSHSWKIMPTHLININTYLGKNVKFHSNLDIVIGKIKCFPLCYKQIFQKWRENFSSIPKLSFNYSILSNLV